MLIALPTKRTRDGCLLYGLILTGVMLLSACHTTTPPPLETLDAPVRFAPLAPDKADLASVSIAATVLGDCDQSAHESIEEIASFDRWREENDQLVSGLLPYAQAAVFACIDDDVTYRQKESALLKEDDLDPALRARLEQETADDPLLLAKERLHDERTVRYGSAYNRMAGPVGRLALSGILIPLTIIRGIADVFASEKKREPLSLRERQALAHWQEYLSRHPDTQEARKLEKRVKKFEKKYVDTMVQRQLREARKLMAKGFPEGARYHLEAALGLVPDLPEAKRLLAIVERQSNQRELALQRSLQAPAQWLPVEQLPKAYEISSALLLESPLPSLPTKTPKPVSQPLAFANAMTLEREGREKVSFKAYGKIGRKWNASSGMQRHARSIIYQPSENPYRFFRKSKKTDGWRRTRWVMLGPLANGPKRRGLFRPLEWVLDAPMLLNTVVTLPGRLMSYSRMKPWPFSREVAVHAKHYLARYPGGEHENKVLDYMCWLENRRGNAIGTLKYAQQRDNLSTREEQKLKEKAAKQMLLGSNREPHPDLRMAMLQRTAGEFPETKAGQEAGEAARKLWDHLSPQQIRITRGFLEEHPEVAGPHGLGLSSQLLDEEPRNGELHPEGVTILGGQVIRIAYIDLHGKKKKPPEYTYEKLSTERLARLIALLDETSQHKERADSDYEHGADASRDHFFERAKLGLTDTPDLRSGAYSSYTFEGVREKYGLVRSRESILPVDLVFQGSIGDMSLGAFPRLRLPEPTPDAILYR